MFNLLVRGSVLIAKVTLNNSEHRTLQPGNRLRVTSNGQQQAFILKHENQI